MISKLAGMFPQAPDYQYRWSELENSFFGSLIRNMAEIKQNSEQHREGDVWAHTRMVCNALCEMEEFRALTPAEQTAVSLAALLHDVGKIISTRFENGDYISPGHSLTGAGCIREILWKYFGLSGKKQYSAFREAVCMMIRYHSTPIYIHNHIEPEKRLLKIASNHALVPLFSIRLICLLAEANIRGRVCGDKTEMLSRIDRCRRMAKDCGCYYGARAFESDREYYDAVNTKKLLFPKTQACVIMLSGLPGSGKDEWIQKHAAGLPVISMDNVRKLLNIPPSVKSAEVSRAAQDQAKAYLRSGKSFVWNATNLAETTRSRLIRFFETYGASVRLVYLETNWYETLKSNAEKPSSVPIHVLEEMLSKLSPPERFEAESVLWDLEEPLCGCP